MDTGENSRVLMKYTNVQKTWIIVKMMGKIDILTIV